MRLSTKIINGSLSPQSAFVLSDRKPYLFTFQEISAESAEVKRPAGFYVECYEQKKQGKLVGYVYAGIKGNKLELNIKNQVLTDPYLKELMNQVGVKDYRRHGQKRVVNAVKVQKSFSVKGKFRTEEHKGFGKLLIRLAIEMALEQYRLQRLLIWCTEESFYFYHHILKMTPGPVQRPHPFVAANLEEAQMGVTNTPRKLFLL
jgi:hypothetical protein